MAATIDTWWPEIDTFVQSGITNARTETPTTPHAGYDSTAPATSGPQPRIQGDCPS